jgi:hypothetical protein
MAVEPCTVVAQFDGWERVGELRVLSFAVHVDQFTPELQAVLAIGNALQLTVGPTPRPPTQLPEVKHG